MNLQVDELSTNTPVRRWQRVAVPAYFRSWSFETFPNGQEEIIQQLRRWLAVPTPPRLVLWGPTGTGKTGLACGALRVAAEAGTGNRERWNIATAPVIHPEEEPEWSPVPVWFEMWRGLRDRLRRSRGPDDPLAVLRERVMLLVIDDIDVDAMTPWKESIVLSLLDDAPAMCGLVLTMNVAPDRWAEHFGERIADRLLAPRVRLLAVHGGSRRG